MLPVYPEHGFTLGHRKPHILGEQTFASYSQEDPVLYINTLGTWCAQTYDYEASPWAWQWNKETMTQKVSYERASFDLSFIYGEPHSQGYNLLMSWSKHRRLSHQW